MRKIQGFLYERRLFLFANVLVKKGAHELTLLSVGFGCFLFCVDDKKGNRTDLEQFEKWLEGRMIE